MLVVMQSQATGADSEICERIESLGFRSHSVEGTERYAIAVTGDLHDVESCGLEDMPGVQQIIRISKPFSWSAGE